MSEESPRKASSILLDLESKMNTIMLHLQNVDTNIKLILNRLSNNAVKQVEVQTEIKPKIEQNAVINDNLINKKTVELEKEEELTFVQVTNNSINSGRKVAVQQRIMYEDGKNVCLANVEIKDKNNNIVKKIRTNAMGKWISTLEPGNYIIHILKSATTQNSGIDANFSISVSESDKPLELPPTKV